VRYRCEEPLARDARSPSSSINSGTKLQHTLTRIIPLANLRLANENESIRCDIESSDDSYANSVAISDNRNNNGELLSSSPSSFLVRKRDASSGEASLRGHL